MGILNLIHGNIWLKSFSCLILSYLICSIGIRIFLNLICNKTVCRQPIRESGPQNHISEKKNTPTFGGVFIVLATILTTIILIGFNNPYIPVLLFIFIAFALIGLTDDLMKVVYKNSNGFRGSYKLIIQFLLIGATYIWLGQIDGIHNNNRIFFPLFDHFSIGIGATIYVLFFTFVIVGTSNAVNLTDGLDGLVSVPAIINLTCLIVLILSASHQAYAQELKIPFIKNSATLIYFCLALMGAIIGFLQYNLKPAKIFMGDVGSLAIGSVLGLVAIITKQEFVFFFISLLFVIEALSVILQVGSYKIRKKRIFLMAPIHHHFEKLGWSEKKVVRGFWLSSLVFAGVGMIILFF